MSTGACGINCDVCKLRLLGICSTCGSGTSQEAVEKLDAQRRAFGGVCTILDCAKLHRFHYCLRDCNLFPCENFSVGPYPFSEGFLRMQARRRMDRPPALDPNGCLIQVPPEFWHRLKERDLQVLQNLTLTERHGDQALRFRSFHEDLLLDLEGQCLKARRQGAWVPLDDPLLELISLLYFNNVQSIFPTGKDLVGVSGLKEAWYFAGRHALPVHALHERYGDDEAGFREAALFLGGKPMETGDAGYLFRPFPRVALGLIYNRGDEEFQPGFTLLMDRAIEEILSSSGIWVLAQYLFQRLVQGPDARPF